MERTGIAEELKRGNTITYFTIGVSMRPLLIERKTHVYIEPLKIDDDENLSERPPADNDIILYVRKNGTYVLHRLIKQDERYYYMRGDNTFGLEPILKEQAIGRVKRIFRKGRYIEVESNKWYNFYVWMWRINYPIRLLLFKGKSVLRKIVYKH